MKALRDEAALRAVVAGVVVAAWINAGILLFG